MDEKTNGLYRDFIIHPGETLKEILDDREMTQRELALRTGVTEPHISNIIKGLKNISVSYAKKLEYALGIDASFWINLQANYDKEIADFEEINSIDKEELDILARIKSITEYVQELGLIYSDIQSSMLVIEWRKILNISNLRAIPEISQTGSYRLAMADTVDPYILFTWIRVADLITANQQVEQGLDIEKLVANLNNIRELAFLEFEDIHAKLKEIFAECGIKFSIIRHFTGAPVQGILKKNNDGTLSLIMTIRNKFADIFWFTLFHEIGHIINGDIDDRLIDYDFAKNELEDRADQFAQDKWIEPEHYQDFVSKGRFSLTNIKEFCAEQNIPTFILIGRLQREKILNYSKYSNERIRYELHNI